MMSIHESDDRVSVIFLEQILAGWKVILCKDRKP